MTLSKRRGEEIESNAEDVTQNCGRDTNMCHKFYVKGATHYATQLEEVERKLEKVKGMLLQLIGTIERDCYEGWATVVQHSNNAKEAVAELEGKK